MIKFVELAKSVTRRGDFYKHVVKDINGKSKTWISTGADDVFITDVRDSGSMISPDQAIEVLNQSRRVAALLEELNNLSGSISAKELQKKLEPFV